MSSWAARRIDREDDPKAAAKEALKALPLRKHGVAHPFPVGDKDEYKSQHTNKEINAAIEDAPIKSVRLDSLTAIQNSVNPLQVARYIDNPDAIKKGARSPEHGGPIDYPIVVRQDGVNFLHDGHNRATAAWLSGEKSIEARVVDFDAE